MPIMLAGIVVHVEELRLPCKVSFHLKMFSDPCSFLKSLHSEGTLEYGWSKTMSKDRIKITHNKGPPLSFMRVPFTTYL